MIWIWLAYSLPALWKTGPRKKNAKSPACRLLLCPIRIRSRKIQPDQLEEFLAAQATRKTVPGTATPSPEPPRTESGLITIDDVTKLQLRVATILQAERVPKTDKLVQLRVKIGSEERTIVAGIGKHYDPAVLIGKQIVIVANLQPRSLRGITSQGMLLAASAGDEMTLLTPMSPILDGAEIH